MNTSKCDEASLLHVFTRFLGITAVAFLMLVSIAGAGIPNSGSSNISISNKSDEAIKAYDRVIEFKPYDSYGCTTKGNALYKLNKFDESINRYDKSIEISPQNSKALYNKGVALDHLNKSEEALTAYDKAIEINPWDSDAWYNKGLALDHLNRYDEAITAFDKVLEINPQLKGFAQ